MVRAIQHNRINEFKTAYRSQMLEVTPSVWSLPARGCWPGGYAEVLAAIADPSHEEHARFLAVGRGELRCHHVRCH
jgi:hypothetical protein